MPAVDAHTHVGGRRAAPRGAAPQSAPLPRGGRRCAAPQGSMSGVGVSSVGGPAAARVSKKNHQSEHSRDLPTGGKACNTAQYRQTAAADCDHGPRSVTNSAKKNDTAFGFGGAGTQSAQEGSPGRGLAHGSMRRQYGTAAGAPRGAAAIRSSEFDGYTTVHMP